MITSDSRQNEPTCIDSVPATPPSFPILGKPISMIFDRFDYLRNNGPPKPNQVVYVSLYEHSRSGGVISWIIFAFLVVCAALFGGIGVRNIVFLEYLSCTISILICISSLIAAFFVWQRLRFAREDRQLRSSGQYRPGLYLDDEYLIVRYSNAFSCFPREFVDGIRANAKYDSETKQTVWHFVLSYRNQCQERKEIWLEDTFGHQQGSIVRLITRWMNRKK